MLEVSHMATEINFAEQQHRWDTNPPLEMCRRKGEEHAAYGWAFNPPPHLNAEQRAAYIAGFVGDDHE